MARDLRATQPAMGVFQGWSVEWSEMSRSASSSSVLPQLHRWVRTWSVRLRGEQPRLLAVARRRFPAAWSVLTISRSETVRRSILGLPRARRPRMVLVLESHPGGEGREQARELRRAGVVAIVVPDAEGACLARSVDLVLIGADSIYGDGSVVHKVGTRPIALAAHRAGTPVVVLSGHSKAVRRERPVVQLPPLFDRTPAFAISEYWTDAGWVPHGRWAAGRFLRG